MKLFRNNECLEDLYGKAIFQNGYNRETEMNNNSTSKKTTFALSIFMYANLSWGHCISNPETGLPNCEHDHGNGGTPTLATGVDDALDDSPEFLEDAAADAAAEAADAVSEAAEATEAASEAVEKSDF